MAHRTTRFPYSRAERTRCLAPLATAIRSRRQAGETVLVGLQGGQGTGKTTLAAYLAHRLTADGFRVVSFSLDDFYTPLIERERLASRYPRNPFYRLPRGMPGTHDAERLRSALRRLRAGEDVDLPVFDKSAHGGRGDRSAETVPVRSRQDFAIFEGWCLGLPACGATELIGICRTEGMGDLCSGFASRDLATVLTRARPYQRLWRMLDFLIMLRPDAPSLHERWRLQQEHELIARKGCGMTDEQLRQLVRHFLPFTLLCYARANPDVLVRIGADHHLYALESRAATGVRSGAKE
jgi:D-glycerate 3-kinase